MTIFYILYEYIVICIAKICIDLSSTLYQYSTVSKYLRSITKNKYYQYVNVLNYRPRMYFFVGKNIYSYMKVL